MIVVVMGASKKSERETYGIIIRNADDRQQASYRVRRICVTLYHNMCALGSVKVYAAPGEGGWWLVEKGIVSRPHTNRTCVRWI